ncbi:MAG: hypothetical protein AAF517_17130 [Planctomycetota bacterium]
MLSSGCDDDDGGVVSVNPPDPKPLINRSLSVLSLNASDGEVVTETISVSLKDADGNDPDTTSDADGNAASSFSVTSGSLMFAYDAEAALPVTFTVTASASGFVSSTFEITVEDEGATSANQSLVAFDNTPDGVEVTEEQVGFATATGAISDPIEIGSAKLRTAEAQITAGAGTILTDANGDPLFGQITAAFGTFNVTIAAVLDLFPGSFEALVDEALRPFIVASFAYFEITDASGDKAASVSSPFTVELDIAAGTVNPNTGEATAIGDEVGIFGFNSTTGTWTQLGTATAQDGDGGSRTITFTTDHIGFIAAGWTITNFCATSRTIQVNGGNDRGITVTIGADNLGFRQSQDIDGEEGDTLTFPSLPGEFPLDLVFTLTGSNEVLVENGEIVDFCDGNVIVVAVSPPAVTTGSVSVSAEEVCRNNTSESAVLPSAHIFVRRSGGTWQFVGETDADGMLSASEVQTGNYEIRAVRGDQSSTVSVTVSEDAEATASLEVESAEDCTVNTGSTGSSE